MIEDVRTLALVAATMTMGLMAGYFALYAHTIMPGLGTTDDRTFVGSFQALDRAIINPWFMATGFLGSLAFTTVMAKILPPRSRRGERVRPTDDPGQSGSKPDIRTRRSS